MDMCKFSLSVSCLNSGTFDEVSTLFLMKSAFLGTVLEKESSLSSGMSIPRITTVERSLWAVTSSLTKLDDGRPWCSSSQKVLGFMELQIRDCLDGHSTEAVVKQREREREGVLYFSIPLNLAKVQKLLMRKINIYVMQVVEKLALLQTSTTNYYHAVRNGWLDPSRRWGWFWELLFRYMWFRLEHTGYRTVRNNHYLYCWLSRW